MLKKFLIIVLLIIFAAVIIWAVFVKKVGVPAVGNTGQGNGGPAAARSPEPPPPPPKIVIIFKADGFSPKVLKIKKDDMVEFKNESQTSIRPASASHPTHTVYPGSDIKKCGTSEAGKIFDTCRGLKSGESWFFRFDEKGEWKYHDHLNAGVSGTVIVE